MSYESTKTIRADEARRMFGVSGEGIVWAVMDSGIHRNHVHFKKNGNLVLPPPLRHADFSALTYKSLEGLTPDLSELEALQKLAPDLSEQEALVDWNGGGTHAASIICGESWQEDPNKVYNYLGIAPKCKVLSLKVFPESGASSELNILVALKWLKSISHSDGKLVVHGLNLNFSLTQDVHNFACGQTPVCEAVNELVRLGLVCIAPAGNSGYRGKSDHQGESVLSSIGDPGNAELAITVGSTHRRFPREYGASYFSSRGPTIDGRAKPDLLAPGEEVTACWINGPEPQVPKRGKRKAVTASEPVDASYSRRDGTSVAVAHVAGVVALLLSARPELMGRPLDVKGLLMQTAIDLKRASWVQGSGLVDAVRLLEAAQKPMHVSPTFTPVPTLSRTPIDQQRDKPEDLPAAAPRAERSKRFAIGLSFPGSHRELVQNVTFELRRRMPSLGRKQILYDRFHEAELARADLDVYLPKLYAEECELIVAFLGGDYTKNQWCGLEWRAIRDLIKKQQGQNIMPLRLDLAEVPGLFSTDGYMDVRDREPEEIAAKIIERLQLNRQAAQRQQ